MIHEGNVLKSRCLALLHHVARMKDSIVMTKLKRGEPIARPASLRKSGSRPTLGSVSLIAHEDEAYYGTGQSWDGEAERPTFEGRRR